MAQDQKQFDLAVASFTKAHELDASEPVFTNNLADLYRLRKQYDKANEWIDRTLAINPSYAPAHNLCGLVAQDLKRFQQAFASYSKACELDDTEPVYPENMANLYRRQKQFDKANEWIDRTLAINPSYASAHNQRGLVAQELKQFDLATASFMKAHELDPSEPNFECSIGWHLLEQLDLAKSMEWAQKALGHDAQHAASLNLLGAISFTQKHWDEAARLFAQAESIDPQEAVFVANQANARLRMAQFGEVERLASAALQLDPDNADAYWSRGMAAHLTDGAGCEALSERALELEPSFCTWLLYAAVNAPQAAAGSKGDALVALTSALDVAKPLEREQNADFMIYAIRVVQAARGPAAVRASVLRTGSALWESLKQAVDPNEANQACFHDALVKSYAEALVSPLFPKQQLLAAWGIAEVPLKAPDP